MVAWNICNNNFMLNLITTVNSSAVSFDIFQGKNGAGKCEIETIDRVWDEIACFQIADVPGRTEPTSEKMTMKHSGSTST